MHPDFTQDEFTVNTVPTRLLPYNDGLDKIEFDRQEPVARTLTDLRDLYDSCETRGLGVRRVAQFLQKVNSLTVDPTTAPDNAMFADPQSHTVYKIPDHNIDYLFAFAKHEGLDPLLPPIGIQRPHDWIFQMHLGKPTTKLRTKYGLVGFNPNEAVLCIGQQGLDHIWLAMCLNEELVQEGGAYPANEKFSEQTCMSAANYRIVVAYLLLCLSAAGVEGIMVNHTELWKIPLDPNQQVNWAAVTNNSVEEYVFRNLASYDSQSLIYTQSQKIV